MSTSTLERTEVAAPAIALTPSEENSLITLAASTEKTKRVRALRSGRTSRAWSVSGDVD